MTKLSTQIPMT